MHTTNKTVKKLLEYYKEIYLLDNINAALSWDLNVSMPPNAAQTRADQTAYLTKLTTEKWLNPEIAELVNSLASDKNLTDEDKALLRVMRHALKYYTQIPKELIIEFSQVTSLAFVAWNTARQNNNFAEFLPHLKAVIKISQLFAQHLTYKDDPYDALLDLYEPGLTTKRCKELFSEIQDPLSQLIKKITKSKNYAKELPYLTDDVNFDLTRQQELSHYILKKMGYDFNSGRLDVSPHPFTIGLGDQDIRITTAYKSHDFRDSLTASIHEGGHALYEQGIDPAYIGTPLGTGVSLGIHESQSRFWENQIGRHPEFIKFITPLLHAFFPSLENADSDMITLMFNHVKPGNIRIEADEVTYNLHIILRFELEHALINETLDPKDLPEAWNKKMKKFLGVTPESDSVGVLQDVHWSYGSFGYFPTYTLGNLYAAQIRTAMLKEKDYESNLSKGDLGTPLGWLRENIHRYGSVYTPDELIKKATGKTLSSKYYLNYITEKYTSLYQLES